MTILSGMPAYPVLTALIVIVLGAPAELHIEADFRAHDLPRIPEAQPLVRKLDLPAVTNRLIEDAELVADSVADGRNVERCQRVHVAGRQTAEPTVSKTGFLFLFQKAREVLADLGQSPLHSLPETEADEAVAQMRSSQEFSGEISDNFGGCARSRNAVHRGDIVIQHAIANGVGQGHVPVVARCMLRQLGLQIVQVVYQGFGNLIGSGSDANVRVAALIADTVRFLAGDSGFHDVLRKASPSALT